MQLKNLQLKSKVEVGFKFEMTFLTQHLGLSIFYPTLGHPSVVGTCRINIEAT